MKVILFFFKIGGGIIILFIIGMTFRYFPRCPSNVNSIIGTYELSSYSSTNQKEILVLKKNKYIHFMNIFIDEEWKTYKNEGNWFYNSDNCSIIFENYQYKSVIDKKIKKQKINCEYYYKKYIRIQYGYELMKISSDTTLLLH